MLTLDQAREGLLEQALPVGVIEEMVTLYACGRILAEDIVSEIQVPPLDNSQMDGYAVRVEDLSSGNGVLPVSQRIAAGQMGQCLEPGTCARIFTGAPIPAGADAVIPQEETTIVDRGVSFEKPPVKGQWIRKAGCDIAIGDVVLRQGERLTPAAMGVAASIGVASVKVFSPIRVALFFTGDELAMPGESLVPGGIYNSNRYVLRGLLHGLGCEVLDLGNVPDTLEATIAAFKRAATSADLIITSGGMSVGEADYVKPAIEALGRLEMWKIAMKPGKPVAKGTIDGVHFIGLPGNPVSGFVTFLLLARPFILRLQGRSNVNVKAIQLPLAFEWKGGSRREFIRVRRNATGALENFKTQNSAVLSSCVWADGLADIPVGATLKAGDCVTYIPFAEFKD